MPLRSARRSAAGSANRRRFVLLSTQRSGSTWLVDMLDSHDRITAYGELLLSPAADGTGDRRMDYLSQYLAPRRDRSRVRRERIQALQERAWTLRYVHGVFKADPDRVTGFKLMYDQVRDHREILGYLALRRVQIVHLVRANLLDTVLSRYRAWRTGLHHTRTASLAAQPLVVDPARLLADVERLSGEIAVARRWLRVFPGPVLEVAYEDLLERPEAFARVLSFLGVDPRPELRSSFRKITTGGHRETIENYEEVRRALEGSCFGSLLRP